MEELLTTSQVARMLECSAEWVRVLERTGRLKAQRAGNTRIFRRRDVEKFLAEHKRQRAEDLVPA